MKITKTGSTAEVDRKNREERLKIIKDEVEKVKNWSKDCKCEGCGSEFTINVNDIKKAYMGENTADEWSTFRYGLKCPVCGKEYMFSANELPLTGPGYNCLCDVLKQNKAVKYGVYDAAFPTLAKTRILSRRNRYFK